MGIAASDLNLQVIRPTLAYLERQSVVAETLLLAIAAGQSALGSGLDNQSGLGLYRISESSHQQLWDKHLAKSPELASRARGLASQHAFLQAPHLELTANLRYATAIAWLLIESRGQAMPQAEDLHGLAQIWQQVFAPQRRQKDFMMAWQRCVIKALAAA